MGRYLAFRRAIIAVIREERERVGMSKRALSRALEQSSTYIHEIERGQHRVRVEELIAIAYALGTEPDVLLRRILTRLGR